LSAEPSSGTLVRLPKLGQSMEAATIMRWHAAEGDEVKEGQLLVSFETDKATYDLEAPASGWLHIDVAEGEEVEVETVLARVLAAPGEATPTPARRTGSGPARERAGTRPAPPAAATTSRVLASPKAKRRAAELGIDLAAIQPSSPDGIISAEDVEQAVAAASGGVPTPAGRRESRRERLAGSRATMARRLQQAWHEIPHIVQMVDVDATGLLATRAAFKRRGIEVSVNDLLLQASASAMAATPALNVSLQGDEIVHYEGVDVGFAVETDRGLYVPVIRGADGLSPEALAAEAARLSAAARGGTLRPGDMGGASLTVSNLGMYGIKAGTPVINPGEPVLVFAGAIEDRAVAIGAAVSARPTLTLSIAYDHRLAGGAGAAAYTMALKRVIEQLAGEEAQVPAEPGEPRHVRTTSSGTSYRVDVQGPGGHAWTLDEPVAEGGTGSGATPVDGLLGALLGCITISFRAAARRRKVPVERIEGRARANPRRAIKEIALELDVWSSAPEEDVRALLEPAEHGCWVRGVLKPEISYTIELNVIARQP
jgi:pyruvate/2-oxoglutarate dehydrogenase complex dihydrolipoamide acyltransferase (E2) component/uncharacterized OsmC-like protein